ncbi:MAG: HEPN/Toprim-associated domain-containing protein [Pseudomonadota bacterium]
MGTSIELEIGAVSLDYAKNHMGADYGYLFQQADLCHRRSDQISYADVPPGGDSEEMGESEEAFVRPLSRVLSRLRVLGHSIEGARAEYQAVIDDAVSLDDGDEEDAASRYLSFDEFCALVCKYPVASLADAYVDYDTDDRQTIAQGRFAADEALFDRLPWTDNSDLYWSEASYLAAKLGILSPASMLEVFALNPANAHAPVIWQFGPIVTSGWVTREAFQAGASRTQTLLVATEGASDARILRRALDLLRPDVADFFRFIDGEERHHFWGTGNLVKFAEGLMRIDVRNQVLFLLDNDAEGVDAYRKLEELKLPGNMRAMVLPALEVFRDFPARGPDGVRACDINGRAAAIECYLDLNLPQYPPAQIVWSNYKKELDAWQGALEHKESYMRHFFDQDAETLAGGGYDISKLVQLLDALIAEVSCLTGADRIKA